MSQRAVGRPGWGGARRRRPAAGHPWLCRGSSWHRASGAGRSALLRCRPGPGGQLFVIFNSHIKSELRPKARVPC